MSKTTPIFLELPVKRFPLLVHKKNVEYAINLLHDLASTGLEAVIGFDLYRSLGIVERNYRIMDLNHAIELKKNHPNFDYIDSDKLSQQIKLFDSGRYITKDGLIVSISKKYLHELECGIANP